MKKILFNDKFCLTQDVLAGTKTMTRRVLRDNVPLGNWEETQKHLPWKSHTNLTHPGKYFRPSKVKIMRPTSPK